MKNKAFRGFKTDITRLNETEKHVLDKLFEATQLIEPLFLSQENNKYPGANFYPHDITTEELEKTAKKNSELLSPFTIVERKNGKLVAIPYEKYYAKGLKPVIKLMRDAAEITQHKRFGEYLLARARAFEDGSFKESWIQYLNVRDSTLDLVIGPIERYLDKLTFIKTAFQANLRIKSFDPELDPEQYKAAILGFEGLSFSEIERKDWKDKIRIRVDDIVATAGWHARYIPNGSNYPNELDIAERYGTQHVIYQTSIHARIKDYYKIFTRIFPKEITSEYSLKLLEQNAVRRVILHEIGHSLNNYRGMEERLKEEYGKIDELKALIFGVKNADVLLRKGMMTPKDYQALLILLLTDPFLRFRQLKTNPSVVHHLLGYSIYLNIFLENGAIKIENNKIVPIFSKIRAEVFELADKLIYILSEATRDEAKEFTDRYANYAIMERLEAKLKDLELDKNF